MAKDSKMYYLAEDIQKIQVKTNMYINEYGEQGAFHLAREIIQNSFDECLDEDSQGNKIEVRYDVSTDTLTSIDNGRGFDERDFPMNIFCTTLQSGSKFFRSSGAASAGEFGVGLTVVNALSDYFSLTSYREAEGTIHTIEYEQGVLKSDKTIKNPTKRHGVSISFMTSKKYMGNDAKLPMEDVINWIESLFFLDSERLKAKGITCEFCVYDGVKLLKTFKFKPQPFSSLLKRMIPAHIKKSFLTDACSFDGKTSFTENSKTLVTNDDGTTSVENVDVTRDIHLDVAFLYCTSPDEDSTAIYDTYCNYTNTIENGVHMDAFDEAYCRFMQQKVNATMSDTQKEKLKITWEDIRTNLYCVLNLSTNAYVGFVGNAKTRISNKELIPYIKDIITRGLEEFFSHNAELLNTFIKLIKLNAKARLEAAKAKVATNTERLNSFKEHLMKNYIRPNNTGKQWKELFLCEGDSAASSARNGSDPNTQGFMLLRGVPLNAEKSTLTDVMNNVEYRDLVTILGCGIGKNFDMSKLKFNRINILTDSDVDGDNISSSLLDFLYKFLRPLIEAGLVYKVYSPLYELNDKDYSFVTSKAGMVEIYHKKIQKKFKISIAGSDNYFTKSEFKEFLNDTYDYRENLMRAADSSGRVNKFLVELIIALLTISGHVRSESDFDDMEIVFGNQKFIKSIMNIIQKTFKETVVDNEGRFDSIIDGKSVVIKVGNRFFKKTADLIPVYQKYGYKLMVKEDDKEAIEMTIGEFLDLTNAKVLPQILHRFKGLGELNGNQLWKTTLDINNRTSIQYTVDDVEKELGIFKTTHGGSKKDAANRRVAIKNYKLKREDLDN